MGAILAIALPWRLLALFLLGTVAGGFVNLAVYRLAWNTRAISPWSSPPSGAQARKWSDRIPLVGWWGLSREEGLHGRGFWIRPIVVELLCGLMVAGMYYWETVLVQPWFVPFAGPPPAADLLSSNLPLVAHLRFVSHALLLLMMLAASLIDLDEKTIPDAVTVPGAWLGLILAAVYPWSMLSAGHWLIGGQEFDQFLTLVSVPEWPDDLNGLPETKGLAVGLVCWLLWCVGLLPRRWNTRHGWGTAVRVFVHRLRAESITYAIALMGIVGAALIVLAAWLLPRAHWAGLLTALVGMAAGGAIIWVVRIVGTTVLRREAMGFGDVTLMAMIGTFVGWQPALVVFFLAPFFALVIAITQWVAHGEHEIPYGPFLCLATMLAILKWHVLWERVYDVFSLGYLVPVLLAVCMLLMGVMLLVYRTVRDWILGQVSA